MLYIKSPTEFLHFLVHWQHLLVVLGNNYWHCFKRLWWKAHSITAIIAKSCTHRGVENKANNDSVATFAGWAEQKPYRTPEPRQAELIFEPHPFRSQCDKKQWCQQLQSMLRLLQQEPSKESWQTHRCQLNFNPTSPAVCHSIIHVSTSWTESLHTAVDQDKITYQIAVRGWSPTVIGASILFHQCTAYNWLDGQGCISAQLSEAGLQLHGAPGLES